ncbi:hypothetical protein HHL16_03950 [Pseudoflavitalea sp. G-6-1-2]|uniref:hypothetical protein n=1 Tax=Pseudoflavitalea sp. G-6-1-2 TaxID=2728841 RepID=UPI00146B6221|nr:hypothetical protein [Pseudoflavitalea sp. G-6-1-2]NML20011.1 hypothetical protein [Pseudoflavitalea sp. G-6-1-2]
MTYELKFFKTVVSNRKAVVKVEEVSDKWIVYFQNDDHSDFINSFKAFGFWVSKTDTINPYHVLGTFPEDEARKVWENISPRLKTPDHVMKGTIPDLED